MSGGKWKLKLLYVMKMFLEETDEENTLTVPQIIKKLEEYMHMEIICPAAQIAGEE